MKVTVFQKDFDTNEFVRVAVVNAPTNDELGALEYAYRYTNNVDGSWSMKIGADANDNVEVVAELPVSKKTGKQMGLRSTMMFDRMEVEGGDVYSVDMVGFTALEAA